MRRYALSILATTLAMLALTACGSDAVDPDAERTVQQFVDQNQTILGQTIEYPSSGAAQISSTVLTLQPGEETGWHLHETPLYAYIMEGSLTVDYGSDGTRTYETDDALLEAIGTFHNGTANADAGVRILVVNLGAVGLDNTVVQE